MTNIGKWIRNKWARLYVRMVREKATPEFIARGWAIGMFYGCLVPFGLQLVLSIPTAFLLKGSKLGATLGTLITNHFTIWLIYPCQCYVGAKLMGATISFGDVEKALATVIKEQDFSSLMELGTELIAAFFLGGALLTAIMTPLTYWLVKRTVVDSRRLREWRQRKRQAKLEKQKQ